MMVMNTHVIPENASNYSSYSSAQASSDIGVDVPSPKPKPKPRMLNAAQQADRKQNTPSPTYVAPTLVEYPPPNSTQLLVTPNVPQEGIDEEIAETAAAVRCDDGRREGGCSTRPQPHLSNVYETVSHRGDTTVQSSC